MKNKLLYSLIAGAVVMTGLSSCDNEEFLNVTHDSIRLCITTFADFVNGGVRICGMIYAISGIVMNHRDTINPNFSIERKEYKIAEKLPGKEGMKRENVLQRRT